MGNKDVQGVDGIGLLISLLPLFRTALQGILPPDGAAGAQGLRQADAA